MRHPTVDAYSDLTPTKLGERALPLWQALVLPSVFIVGLVALALAVPREPTVVRAILGAALGLAVWSGWLYVSAARRGRTLSFEVVLFKHHWVQVCTQVVLYGYWAWYVPSIRVFWPLILAQLLFAFPFHILLTWSRRDSYGLGFGPVPITLSFNLFILFRPAWFHWQFGIVARSCSASPR